MEKAIGIDPDASGFDCVLVGGETGRPVSKRFSMSAGDLQKFLRWVEEQSPSIVAIEGINGQSGPIEKALREAGVVFHSFRPSDTRNYRRGVLGENKNNERDAEAVALYALSLRERGKLDRWRRVWAVDAELQLLTRRYESVGKQMTAESNRLWKLLRTASPDLYLALQGKLEEVDCEPKKLRNRGFLTLLATRPQIGEWQGLSEDALMEWMGGGEYKGRRAFVRQLQSVAGTFPQLSQPMTLMIRWSAQQLERFGREQTELESMLEKVGQERLTVRTLKRRRGIGTITATGMIGEMVDVRRFPAEDNLASYSGLGKVQDNSGERERMKEALKYNRRLKDLFMSAAMNVVRFDPDSHLAGYHRNLVKRGMQELEATKRVARALVRVIYRELMALIDVDSEATPAAEEQQEGRSGVASGQGRGDKQHLSDTPLRSPRTSKARRQERVNRTTKRRSSGKVVNGRRARLKKSA